MDDYIKREAAIAYAPLPKHLREYQTMNIDDAWEDGYDFAIGQVEAIPAADVVPVVRCKDCKWWKLSDYNTMGIHICQRFSGVRGEHDFCSRGEVDNG